MQSRLAEPIFSNLPEEILFEIFKYYSVNELRSSTLVCKKWGKIITENRTILYAELILQSFPEEFPDKAVLFKRVGKCNLEMIYAELHLSKKFESISERAKCSTEQSDFALKVSEYARLLSLISPFAIDRQYFFEDFCE